MIPKKVIPRSISSGLGLLWSGRLSCGGGCQEATRSGFLFGAGAGSMYCVGSAFVSCSCCSDSFSVAHSAVREALDSPYQCLGCVLSFFGWLSVSQSVLF